MPRRAGLEEMIGQVLENELRRATADTSIDVPVVGAAHPGACLEYLRRHAFAFGPDLRSAFDLELPNRRILAFCESARIACLDLLPAFRKVPNQELHLPNGDMHWNAAGPRLAGRSLASYLLETGRVPRGRPMHRAPPGDS